MALFTQDVVSPDLASLIWTPSTAYNSGTVEYDIQVDDDPNFTSIDYSASQLSATSASAGSLGVGTWYWRVIARDVNHITAEPAWSNTGTFQVLASTPTSNQITFNWTDAPPDSINIDGTWYGGAGSLPVTITTSFTVEIVGAPGQKGGGYPDPDWFYYAPPADGGDPGSIAAIFTPNDGNNFTIKIGIKPPYQPNGGAGGGASYVAKDDMTTRYAAGAGGGDGGEATYWDDYDEWYFAGYPGGDGESFGSAVGGNGGAGSAGLTSGAGAAGSPGGDGGSGSAGVTPTSMSEGTTTPRVTITLD